MSLLKGWLKEPLWWRKEARKSRQYIFTDELTYISQAVKIESTCLSKRRYIYRYLKGDILFEIAFNICDHGYPGLNFSLIELDQRRTGDIPSRDVDYCAGGDNEPVLINIGEVTEDGKRMLSCEIPVIMRLYLHNDFLRRNGNLLDHLGESRGAALPPIFKEREGSIGGRYVHSQSGKLPSKMVKATSQVVDSVTHDRPPTARRPTNHLHSVDVESMFQVRISLERIRLSIRKSINFPLQFTQMLVRPVEFQPSIF